MRPSDRSMYERRPPLRGTEVEVERNSPHGDLWWSGGVTEASDQLEVVWSVLRRGFGRVPAALPIATWQSESRDWFWHARSDATRRERRALLTEHAAAVATVSPLLHRVLGGRLVTFDSAVTAALQSKADRRNLTAARRAVNRLGGVLDEPETRQAAWDDIVVAAQAATSLDDARAAVVQLETLLGRAGFDPKHRVRKLSAILEGSALDIAEGSVALGRRRRGRWPHHHARSRLASQGRLDLCRDLVAVRAEVTTCFVWLAYRRARLGDDTLHAGTVTFTRLDAARDAIRTTGSLFGTPFTDAASLPADDPDDDIAIVQVILENHLPRDAVADAVAIVDAVTGDVAADAIGTTWQRLGWSRVRYASGGGATSSFTTPAELADIRRSYDHERAAQRLADRADRLTRAVRRQPPYDPLIADALRSRADAKVASSARNAIVLLGRSAEAAAAASGLEMDDVRELAMVEWPWAAIRADLRQWTNLALRRDDIVLRHDRRLAHLARQIITEVRETWSDLVNTEAVVRLGGDLIDCAENPVEARSANELVRTLTDPQLYLKRVARLKGDAHLYQERSRRVRNALAHGNPVSEPTLTSARVWWEFLADVATHVATEGYGQSPSNAVRTMQRLRERFAAKLASGTPPVEAYG